MRIPLAKYGVREVVLFGGGAALAAVVSALVFPYVTPLFVIAAAFVLYFFRDPDRAVPQGQGILVSPADGRVVEVSQVDEPRYLNAASHKVAIFMSPLDVHVNRAPCAGRVEVVERTPGGYCNAAAPEASASNESVAMVLGGVEGRTRILVRQVAGALARRIVCRAAAGETLERGQRFGMIKIGSRAEVYVPVEGGFDVAVAVGQRVRAGETILGRFR